MFFGIIILSNLDLRMVKGLDKDGCVEEDQIIFLSRQVTTRAGNSSTSSRLWVAIKIA